MTVLICWHCSNLNDPARGELCPCRANTVTEFEVQSRHREAVQRAHAAGWVGHARRRPSNDRLPADPTGRRWAA